MRADETELQKLFQELEHYEQKGVRITLEGSRVSPMQIVNAYLVKESRSYMRDYVMNPIGNLEELGFDNIAKTESDPPRW